MKMRRVIPIICLTVLLVGSSGAAGAQGWRTASREPTGLAPDPATTPEAVVQVYAARAVRWRGYFGVHTWIAVKPSHADAFTVYEVTGWRLRRNGTAVSQSSRAPDGRWFGKAPELLSDLRGRSVDAVIERIKAAVEAYPFAREYRVWPGPNSNTFTAFVLRDIPELRVDFPATAIGKDYLGGELFANSPSGTGFQVSALGVLGVLAGIEEGLEVNLLGLTFGIDPIGMSFKVPIAGRVDLWWAIVLGGLLLAVRAAYARFLPVRNSRTANARNDPRSGASAR